jgi:predicted nucleotidyltransferase
VALALPVSAPTLFASKATGDVLEFLATRPDESYTLSELSQRVGHNKSTVGRAVDPLVENGLLVDDPTGNARLLSIDSERVSLPSDPVTRVPQTEFHAPVRAAVDRLRSELDGVIGTVVYGSVARGTADRRSDIDLWTLVETDRAANQRRANEIRVELESRRFDGERYAFDIDVECADSVPAYAESVRQILDEGVPVDGIDKIYEVEKRLHEPDG